MFRAWVLYTAERRRKACRVAEALQSRHSRLLRDGVTQWLCVAAGMAEIRQKYAIERGAQVCLFFDFGNVYDKHFDSYLGIFNVY